MGTKGQLWPSVWEWEQACCPLQRPQETQEGGESGAVVGGAAQLPSQDCPPESVEVCAQVAVMCTKGKGTLSVASRPWGMIHEAWLLSASVNQPASKESMPSSLEALEPWPRETQK